jgi:NADH-quinone oxidoreductase subunit K
MPSEIALLNNYLVVGAVLFGLGLIGFLCRRNMIVMFLSAEMMLQGVSLSLVAFGRFHNDFGGQMLVVFTIAVAACEAAIAMALITALERRSGSLDAVAWHALREANQPEPEAIELPLEPEEPPQPFPVLAPAGLRPEIPREQTDYRPHV